MLETFKQKIRYWNLDNCSVAFVKPTLGTLDIYKAIAFPSDFVFEENLNTNYEGAFFFIYLS